MKRSWHPYYLWEDWKAGMWRKVFPDEEERFVEAAVRFTGDAKLYGSFMLRVAQEWPFSCEHNLTERAMNRRAWIGHAAACMAIQCPEYLTRRAWWMLTQEQRDEADDQATNAIKTWEDGSGPQLAFEFQQVQLTIEEVIKDVDVFRYRLNPEELHAFDTAKEQLKFEGWMSDRNQQFVRWMMEKYWRHES